MGSRVPMLRKAAITAAVVTLASGLAYGELVRDWRTPRSDRLIDFALAPSTSLLIADYDRLRTAMAQRYGERVSVSVPVSGPPGPGIGMAEVSLDGKIVETHSLKRLSDVYGLFVIGADAAQPIRFPFQLAPDQYVAGLEHSLVEKLSSRFKRSPRAWFAFSDTDWAIDQCASLKSGLDLGIAGRVLGLAEGTSCIVSWQGQRHSSMLVFVGRADGKPWLRTFSQFLCRNIAAAGLRRLADGPDDVEYAACILGDRSTETGPGTSLFGAAYAVKPDHQLARMRAF